MGTTSQPVIDAHAHCGIIDRSWPQSFDAYARQAMEAGVAGAALFSPVLEIYDRYDAAFTDTPAWRQRRNISKPSNFGKPRSRMTASGSPTSPR